MRRLLSLYLAALAGYLLLGLLLLAPLLPQFDQAIPGGLVASVDGWQNVWNLWWVWEALRAGRNPFVSDLIFYPQGAVLHLQTLGITNALLTLPAIVLWGPVAAYNLALLASLALSGLGAFALARRAGAEPWAAFLAGLLFTCSPFHLTRIYDGQLELVALQWLPFYALFLWRALEEGRRSDALLAGALLAVVGYTSWYYLLFMAIYSAAFSLLWARGPLPARRVFAQALLTAASGLLLLLPILLPALAAREMVFAEQATETAERAANLLDFLLPSYLHPLWGEALFAAVGRAWHNFSGDWNVALGYGALGLALLALARRPHAAWPWWVLFGLALTLALGPELRIATWRSGLPLPYALIDALPGLSLGRRPGLFVAVATVALVPLTAIGLGELAALIGPRRPWLWALPLALIVFELTPRPWPLLKADIHPVYTRMANGNGAVLEVPPARYKYSLPQLGQIAHGRPIFGGYLARPPRYAWINDAPALRALWRMQPDSDPPFVTGSAGPLDAMAFYGAQSVLVRWDQITPERRPEVEAAIAQSLPGLTPAYADPSVSLYELPPVDTQHPFASLVGAGWGRSESNGDRRWRWMSQRGELLLVNPTGAPLPLSLRLTVQSYTRPRPLSLSLNGASLGTRKLGQAEVTFTLRLLLPPGESRLALEAPAERENGNPDGRLLSLALLDARIATGRAP